jgi:D-alanyl-D-alanine dipeptidase
MLMADPRVVATTVRECGAPLVDIRGLGMRTDERRGDPDGAFAQLRRGLVARLEEAAAFLPDGLEFLVVEGYRPMELQRRYFSRYRDGLRSSHPDWSADRLDQAASRYVSPPEVAPHCAGAAVDLTLCTRQGEELDMGTRVNASPEESGGACYTDHPGLDPAARANRHTMRAALSAVGLVNYPTEWWHWSFGDRYWAVTTGAPAACYASLVPPWEAKPHG